MEDIIINLAPTGIVPNKLVNPCVPLSIKEIVEDSRRCVDMGVNILHLHARDDSGIPTYKKEIYARLIGALREQSEDVIICVSLSGRRFSHFDQRSDPLRLTGDLKPDMASLTLSSMNFNTETSVNSPQMIQQLANRMQDAGIKPELEVFDSGMVNYAHYLLKKRLIAPPLYFNFILGNIATAQAKPLQLGLMISELPPDSVWAGGGIGAEQLRMNTLGLLYGNGIRVGLEDNLWLDKQRKYPASNVSLVERAIDLATLLGKKPASPADIRLALNLC